MKTTDVIGIAQDMLTRYGHQALALMEQRVQQNRQAGDREAESLWKRVAEAVRSLRTNQTTRRADGNAVNERLRGS